MSIIKFTRDAGADPNITNRIKIANPSLEDELRTYLTDDTDVADVDLPVLSTTGFVISGTVDYFALIGEYGQEKTELKEVDADVGTTATNFRVAALTYSHGASDPVTYMRWNKIKIYGATSSGGSKTLITTIDIDITKQYTEYTYDSATDYSYFYITYINDANVIEEETDYSEEISTTSFTRKSVKRIIESGARKALTTIDENANSTLNWSIALEIIQDGIDEIMARKRRWSFLNTIDTSQSTTINQNYIIKPTNMSQLVYLKVDGYTVDWISPFRYNRYTEGVTTTGTPNYATEKNNKYYLYPTPDAVYDVIFEYYKEPTVLSNLSTEINTPFITPLIYYCASQFAAVRGNDKKADKMDKKFHELLEEQCVEYSAPLQDGTAESLMFTSVFNDE